MARPTETISEPARDIPLRGEYEVVVLGGGPAGMFAAAAAARAGRKTLLVERYGFLGGMGTAAGVTNFCGLFANVHGEIRRVVFGLADELLDRLASMGGLNEPHVVLGKTKAQAYDNAALKCAADELVLSKGAEILFHAFAVGATKRGDAIEALLLETKSGRTAVRGEVFIDASGDGDLAAWAGVPFELGDGQGNFLYPTTMFRVNGVDPAAAGDAWATIPARMDEAERDGRWRFPRRGAIVRPQKNLAEWRVNVTQLKNVDGRAINAVDAAQLSAGEIEGRRQARDFHRFLRAEVPGFADAYILDIAPQIGVRETRRVRGAYQLTGDDVVGCASFDDTIGVNGWPLEQHVAGDVVWRWPDIPASRGFNHLPYRMLVAEGVTNLLVAGRCASMDHDAQSAARVSGACFVMGEAAGLAAHLSLAQRCSVGDVDTAVLQDALEGHGVYLGRTLARLHENEKSLGRKAS